MFKSITGVTLRSSLMRPLINAATATSKFSPIMVKSECAKHEFHTTAIKLGGGDHEYVVSVSIR
jgi:hypothetical protein